MIQAQEILNDTGNFAYRKVPDVDRSQLHLLAVHSDPCVRQIAVDLCPLNQIPLFINDGDTIIQQKVSRRLKNRF